MIERLSRRAVGLSPWWVVLATGLAFLLFMLLVLPGQAERTRQYSEGLGSPDTSLFIGPTSLYQIAEGYGPDGRRQYITARWTFDLLFPLTYAAFFLSAISFSFSRLWPTSSNAPKLALLAVAAFLADLLENATLTALMVFYPLEFPVLAYLAVAISSLKWILVGASMLLAFGGLIGLAFQAFARRVRQ